MTLPKHPVRNSCGDLLRSRSSRSSYLGLAGLLLAAAPLTGHAQQPGAAPSLNPPPTSQLPASPAADPGPDLVTEDLIRALAAHNALSQDDAKRLLEEVAQQRAKREQARTQAAQSAPAPAASQNADAARPEDKPRVRVTYIPEADKQKIKDQVEKDVIATAKAENWALPNSFPDWARRLTITGDFRAREELDMYDDNNAPAVDYQTINSGAPYDVSDSNTTAPPTLNTTKDRQQPRFRLRLGINAKVNDTTDIGMRFESGNNTNPVSSNQTLGTDFNKTTFVIGLAYLHYHPTQDFDVWVGRMPKPFVSTQMVWWEDLAMDGLGLSYRHQEGAFQPFINAGAFSVENTALNFPSTSVDKSSSRDKWLFGAQLGTHWKLSDDLNATGAVAYYYFYHMQGHHLSCYAPTSASTCASDDGRPLFVQKGNTLYALRDLVIPASDPTMAQYQYFGLASPYHILDVTGTVNYRLTGKTWARFDVDFADNLGYNYDRTNALVPVNNYGLATSTSSGITAGGYQGGKYGYFGQVQIGNLTTTEWKDWNFYFGYRYVESDAVVDAFNDPDFHQGGTNAKGYTVGGNLGLGHNTWFNLRYFSATEVSGAPLAIDVLQLDLNARF